MNPKWLTQPKLPVFVVRHHNNTKKKPANKRWTWTDKKVKHLISAIVEFKTLCYFSNVDFSGDLITMYNEACKNLAKEFPEDFGIPSEAKASNALQEMTKEEFKLYKSRLDKEQDLIRKVERVKEKKSIRQDFSKAVVKGTRSGSGKIVYAHWDELIKVWGTSPSTQTFPFGVDSQYIGENSSDIESTTEELATYNCKLLPVPVAVMFFF